MAVVIYFAIRALRASTPTKAVHWPSEDSILETELDLARLENLFKREWVEGEIRRESDRALSELEELIRHDSDGRAG
jgi:hypothetical protein